MSALLYSIAYLCFALSNVHCVVPLSKQETPAVAQMQSLIIALNFTSLFVKVL